jgi:hypothetical protein
MPVPPIAPTARLAALFPPVTDDPPPQTFELGLVLGGTVSEGAYTAGALDFLLQALEAWQPYAATLHQVVIKTAAGSSGGAVCTSILGLLSGRVVPHITDSFANLVQNTDGQNNPLFDLWVNQLQILPMLSPTDLTGTANLDAGTAAAGAPAQHVASLLNADIITQAAANIASFGTNTPPQALAYFAQPFRIAVTVANLRGVPYQIAGVPAIGAFNGAAYVQHDDFAWFALPNGPADPTAALPAGKREDEFWIGDGDAGAGFVGYDTLSQFAAASGAMPAVLASRRLSRPAEHYNYRPNVRAVTEQPGYFVDWPVPDWNCLPDTGDGAYAFTAVDGGTLNNDPVALVHRGLAGLVGHNPQGKSDAKRAMLMIDPLSDAPQPISQIGLSLLSAIGGLEPLLVAGARYLTSDMSLFADQDVYSRFQLVPFRTSPAGAPLVGEAALAGDGLFAAGGWCAREYRLHDFMLGRQNMQAYLRQQLLLAGDNPLFEKWSFNDRANYATDSAGGRVNINQATAPNSYFLPVLPDKTDNGPAAVPPWPAGAFDPETIRQPLQGRLTAVIDKFVKDNAGGGLLPWLANLLIVPNISTYVANAVIDNFKKQLSDAGLLGAPPPQAAAAPAPAAQPALVGDD